ncbi:MAG: hypothetical protein R3C43_19200 [Chloroflexota bacterium]
MSNVEWGNLVLSIADLKVTSLDGAVQANLDAAQEMTLSIVYRVGKLYGNDQLFAVSTRVVEAKGTLSAGSMSTEAMGIILGIEPSTSGVTPNRVTTSLITPNMRLPYFKAYGMAFDENLGALQVLVHKCKVTGDTEIGMKDGDDNWIVPSYDFAVVKSAGNLLVELRQLETAVALPTS